MKENLARADKFEADLVKGIDEFIVKNDIQAPQETLPELRDGQVFHSKNYAWLDYAL